MNEFLSAPPERGGPIGSKPTVHVSRRITVYQIPDSTGCCSESIGYVRMSCLIVGQRATAREHLCNDCATKNATLFADRLWNRDKSFRSQKLSFIRLLPIMFGKGSIGLTNSQTKSGLVLSASPLRFSSVGFRPSKLVLIRDRISRSASSSIQKLVHRASVSL